MSASQNDSGGISGGLTGAEGSERGSDALSGQSGTTDRLCAHLDALLGSSPESNAQEGNDG